MIPTKLSRLIRDMSDVHSQKNATLARIRAAPDLAGFDQVNISQQPGSQQALSILMRPISYDAEQSTLTEDKTRKWLAAQTTGARI
jgi:hypothetical protein